MIYRGNRPKLTKAQSQKLLSDVPEDKVFWSHDGQVFKNLYELERGINMMSDESYGYHANVERNDFSNWIRQVIGDEALAKELERTQDRLDAGMKVEERIHHLVSRR
jgi:hypothetical protein